MNYWQKRALTTRVATIQAAEANISDMARAFARTRDALIQQAESILASIDGDLAKAKQLLRSRELMQYRSRYGALLRQHLAGKDGGKAERILDLLYKQSRVNRLDSMIGQMELLSYELYGKMRGSIEDTLTYSAERGYYGTFHAVETRLHTGCEWAHIDEKKLTALLNEDWSGRLWSDRIWGHVWNFNAQLKDIITRGVLTGSPIRDMATELMGRTNQLRHRCETLVRTETAHVAGAATAMSYKEAGIDEYTYLATLDLKTSEICRSLDQKTFPLSERQEGVNYPPMHPNCRSTTYFSITKNSHSMRAARDPVTGKSVEVPEDWDYGKWYEERVLKTEAQYKRTSKVDVQTGERVRIDPKSIKAINSAQQTISKDFPVLDDWVYNTTFNSEKGNPGGTYMHVDPSTGDMGMVVAFSKNEWRTLENAKKLVKRETQSGAHIPTDDPRAIAAHEYGHAIFNCLALKRVGYDGSGKMSDTMVLKFIEEKGKIETEAKEMLFPNMSENAREEMIASKISQRAKDDVNELFAEAVSSHYYGKSTNNYCEKIFSYLKEGLR